MAKCSNDDPRYVGIEIAAARAAIDGCSVLQEDGWQSYGTGVDPPWYDGDWESGWLAHAIVSHGEDNENDWPWDPTRPIDGQYDEHLEMMRLSEAETGPEPFDLASEAAFVAGEGPPALLDPGERIAEQARHDVAASVARHAEADEAHTILRRAMLAGDPATITVRYGDATWHDGQGWYYTIDDYPDEGSCGAFTFRGDAIDHATAAGYVVSEPDRNSMFAEAMAGIQSAPVILAPATPAIVSDPSPTRPLDASERCAVGIYAVMARDPVDTIDMIAECTDRRCLEVLLEMLLQQGRESTDGGLNAMFVDPVRRRIGEVKP